jgi:outer membrane receptor for ferrienterochelin and colicin
MTLAQSHNAMAILPKNKKLAPVKSLIACIISLSLTSAGCLAAAQNEPTDDGFASMSLEELMSLDVFSAASRVPTQKSRAPGTVYSFDREDFARMGVRRVEDLLQFVPGMQLNQYRKRHRSIWSHGLLDRYNDKLVLLVDGVRMQHLYYGHFSLGDNFPLEKVEKVEIIQGPASSLYGANAFGGIISITTRDFASADASNIELTGEAGSNERGKVSLLANASKIQLFGSRLEQEAPFREERKSFIGGDTLQPLDEDYTNLFVKGTPVEGLTVSLDYYENNSPFVFIPDTQDAFIEEQYVTISARHEIGDLEDGKLETTMYYTDDRATERETEQVTGQQAYNENQDATMAGVSLTGFRQIGSHVLALGVSWSHEQAEDMSYIRHFRYDTGFIDPPWTGNLLSEPDISTDDYAVFVQDIWSITNKLDLTLGARYDEFDKFGGHSNYRAALVYTPEVQQTWKLLYGTAIRTPTYREYLKVLEGSFVAPIPEPERIESFELVYLYQWQTASISIAGYHNNVKDFIREVRTPDGEDEYFANSQNELEINGIDALYEYSVRDELHLRLNVSYIDTDVIGGMNEPYLAEWMAGFNLNYAYYDDHSAGFSVVYNSERKDTNDVAEDDPDAFAILNLFGSGVITSELSYRFGIDNVLDELVYDPAADFSDGYNTERTVREFWLQLQWSPVL